jgi:hypothetical protein
MLSSKYFLGLHTMNFKTFPILTVFISLLFSGETFAGNHKEVSEDLKNQHLITPKTDARLPIGFEENHEDLAIELGKIRQELEDILKEINSPAFRQRLEEEYHRRDKNKKAEFLESLKGLH